MAELGTRLFVSNLPDQVNENDLRSVFSSYGEITNLDLKSKSTTPEENKKFAFITLSASNYNIESCIKYFSNEDFKGKRLYVTRARESFLERLQRERELSQKKESEKHSHKDNSKKHPTIKLGDKLNPRKRKIEPHHGEPINANGPHPGEQIHAKISHHATQHSHKLDGDDHKKLHSVSEADKKKTDSDKKRLESMKKKRQEFKEKQQIIKIGLTGVDKIPNKKVIFSDNEEDVKHVNGIASVGKGKKDKKTLFEDDESDNEVNFKIKEQYEGKQGQKILDLQSRYKSDKRFILDERFIDKEQSENENKEEEDSEAVELEQADEKATQLNILQDVLGVSIRTKSRELDTKKTKSKLGMLRFDPSHPEHAKYLAPVENMYQEPQKKSKKKSKENQVDTEEKVELTWEVQKVEVSKEQFYNVSETLKESLAQPNSFSLRSLFTKNEDDNDNDAQEQQTGYIPLQKPKSSKVKNPLDTGEKNPFAYDSSDSEDEELPSEAKPEASNIALECKAVWKENLFFTMSDQRFKDGLAFFNKPREAEAHKERRELKSLMKKRIYNTERKNQMFKKKIGGRKKSMKKSYRKKS